MWRFLKRRREIKEGDFNPRHTDNSDEVSDEESQLLINFSALVTHRTQKGSSLQESYLSMGFT
jgi:hypothetical protein